MKKINLFRIIYIFIIILIALVAILRPAHIETNILRAFFSDSQKDELLINLSSKYSSNINILLESENSESLTNKKENIIKKIDTTKFKLQNTDINKTLEFYKKYKNNLLSYNDYKLLKSNEYNKITEQAIGNILDPFGITLLPIEEDPFSLYTHYIMSLGNGTFMNSVDGKSYEIINLKVEPNLALSPNLLNTEVKKLIDIQKEFTDNDVKIYLTGTPIHSYYASSKSIKEINIICIISTIFVGGLILWYFHSLKILIPILLSLALGMGMGFCVSSIVFKSIHILTFVFSTTLIGICVDYSLHYLMESDIRKILKSLSISLLSTVCAICILAFTLIRCITVNILANRQYSFIKNKPNKLSKESKKKILQNVKGLIASRIGNVISDSTNGILISAIVGSSILGLYSNYQMITKGLLGFTNILPSAITASLGNVGATESYDNVAESYKYIESAYYLLYAIISIVLVNIINPIVSIFFGASRCMPFSSALLICILFYISNIKNLFYTYKSSLGLYWYDRYRPLITGISDFVLSIILGKIIGFDGIILGTIIAYTVIDLWVEPLIIFHRGFHASSRKMIATLMLRLVFVILLMLGTSYITSLLPGKGLLNLAFVFIVSILITGVVFFICYHKNKYIVQSFIAVRKYLHK